MFFCNTWTGLGCSRWSCARLVGSGGLTPWFGAVSHHCACSEVWWRAGSWALIHALPSPVGCPGLCNLERNTSSSSSGCLPDKGDFIYLFLEIQCASGYAKSAPTSIYTVDVMLLQGAPPASDVGLSVSFHLGCPGLMSYKGHLLGLLTKGTCSMLV